MISFAEALAHVRAAGARRPMPEVEVPLEAALGRVLARDLRSPEAMPGFDNSGMDGFAVRAAEVSQASDERPVELWIAASLAAGDDAAGAADAAGAVEIMTGAPVPQGFDAVIRLEDVEVARDLGGNAVAVRVRAPVERGRNVRPRGGDFHEGDVVARAGEVVRPEHVMALAALGLTRVGVRRAPRVATISTGKELVPASTRPLAPGTIRNSTLPYLASMMSSLGAESALSASIGDEPEALADAIRAATAAGADLVLTTGAVSAGKFDFVVTVLAGLGARVVFHKLAVRPGKPVLLAELPDGVPVLGLPGNPIASAVGLRFLAEPLLRAALGRAPEVPLRARLARDASKPEGLRCFFKAAVALESDGATVEVLPGQGSSIMQSLVRANAWAVLPEAGRVVPAGAEVEVFSLRPLAGWPAGGGT